MSDVSILSQEYETAAQLSQKINRVAIYLKKNQLGLVSASQEAKAALTDAHYLVSVLNALCQRLDPEFFSHGPTSSALNVPGSLVERVQSQRCGDMADYLEDLTRIAQRLSAETLELDDADLSLLDQLASTADAETSSVFRRLMRK